MRLHRWFPVAICHHPAESGGMILIEEEILSFQFETWPPVITWSKSCHFIMGFASPYFSTLLDVWPKMFSHPKYFVFSLPCDLMWAGGQTDMWLHGYVHLTISHQSVNFHGHTPWQRVCRRPYITTLSEDHVTPLVGSSHQKSPTCHNWWSRNFQKRRY